ncbi:MAG: hypothetical protein J3Q66DRAFT_202609 [Benniella sp.]|nr:MAG: hypothetical protein J3Q66DRAFT_202609 [Benniella sp.]
MWLRTPECRPSVDAFTKEFNLKPEFGMRTYGRLIKDATFLSVPKRDKLEAKFKEVKEKRKSDNSFQADFTLFSDSAVEDEDEDEDEDEGEDEGEDEDKKERGNAEEIKADCADDDWGDRQATEPASGKCESEEASGSQQTFSARDDIGPPQARQQELEKKVGD